MKTLRTLGVMGEYRKIGSPYSVTVEEFGTDNNLSRFLQRLTA